LRNDYRATGLARARIDGQDRPDLKRGIARWCAEIAANGDKNPERIEHPPFARCHKEFRISRYRPADMKAAHLAHAGHLGQPDRDDPSVQAPVGDLISSDPRNRQQAEKYRRCRRQRPA
jgi:hypothetical protein